MVDLHDEMGMLSNRLAEQRARLGEVAGQHAEISSDMLPFAGRFRREVLRFHDALLAMQREIADIKATQGNAVARDEADVESPLNRYMPTRGPLSVEEQYERVWRGKTVPKYEGPNLPAASDKLKKYYEQVVVAYHPNLSKSPTERSKRREEMARANEAYVRRDEITLNGMATLASHRSNLPAIVNEQVVKDLREQIYSIEQLAGELEGQIAEMLYGDIARIRAYADVAKAEGQDLIADLSTEVREKLQQARAELVQLKNDSKRN